MDLAKRTEATKLLRVCVVGTDYCLCNKRKDRAGEKRRKMEG